MGLKVEATSRRSPSKDGQQTKVFLRPKSFSATPFSLLYDGSGLIQQSKPRWSNRQKLPRADFPPQPAPKPATIRPAIPASAQSRSKLRTFKFDGLRPETDNIMPGSGVSFADKENLIVNQQQVKGKDVSAHQMETSKEAGREFPSTPAGRIPLADLIGNNEDEEDDAPKSPIEAVTWNQLPQSSNESLSCITPIMRRGKKRPRSSPQQSSQKALAAKPIFDPNAPLKTPQNDPAIDLETRYFARGKHQTPSKPSSSAAPDFMHSSSPSTPLTASAESAKLRRTVSCGIAWPSGHKRRKICADTKTVARRSPTGELTITEKQGELQKINLLLDSIHDGLPESSRSPQAHEPQGSGALTTEDDAQNNHATGEAQDTSRVPQPEQRTLRSLQGEDPALSQHRESPQDPDSSEFGDVDVDLILTSANDPDILSPHQKQEERQLSANDSIGAELQTTEYHGQVAHETRNTEAGPSVSLHLSQSTKQKLCLKQEFDDNDDDEFDEFAADLEMVASMYDQQPRSANAQPEAMPQIQTEEITAELPMEPEFENVQALPDTKPVVDISSDEEFGDDDFEEIANEIERATQAGQDLSTVRLPSQRS